MQSKTYIVTISGNVILLYGKIKLMYPPSDWIMVTEDKETAYKGARLINTMKWDKMKEKARNNA